jgi:hypothetical protein
MVQTKTSYSTAQKDGETVVNYRELNKKNLRHNLG